MVKKSLILGLCAAVLATIGGGALAPEANADFWYGLSCSSSVTTAVSGQQISFWAVNDGAYPYTTLSWSAVGGNPSYGMGSSFTTSFYTSSISEVRVVSVTDGYRTATCTVTVNGSGYPTYTPYPSALQCNPSYASDFSGQYVSFSARGGNGSYSWNAPQGSPETGWGTTFSSRFANYSNQYRTFRVTVTSGWETSTCQVNIAPYSNYTPTPTVTPYGNVTVDHSVRNLTRNDSGTSITARNGDRLQFTVKIATGSRYAEIVHVRDWLPQYVSYVYGSTTVDGAYYQDGIATGNDSNSLALGTLSPNRTTVVRFEATVNDAPKTTLTNTVNVHVNGFSDQTRTSKIKITGSSVTPTPYTTPYYTPYVTPAPYYGGDGVLALSLAARNVTRGQSGEHASVRGRDGDTIDFVLRVRSQNGGYLSNVVITDYLPTGLEYIPRSSTVNGTVTNDGITSGGLNIGTISGTTDTVVKFSARVVPGTSPVWGNVSVTDTAQARADGAGTVSARLALTLGLYDAVTAAAGVKTGPAESVLLAFAVAMIATAGYAAYTRTSLFGRRSALAEIGRASGGHPNFLR